MIMIIKLKFSVLLNSTKELVLKNELLKAEEECKNVINNESDLKKDKKDDNIKDFYRNF
jgi:hypothetical protein